MTAIVQLSDPHVRVGPRDVDAARALAAAVEAVRRLEPRPDAVLLTGDLADDGSARSYDRVRELLAPLTAPVFALPGNRDDRDAIRALFAPPDAADAAGAVARAGDPVQYAVRVGDVRVVLCDTTRAGFADGDFGPARRAWLDAELLADPRTPTIVAMHHPPIAIGMPGLDALGLPPGDRAALTALVARHPQVRRVVCGHVHRAVSGVLGGCVVQVCPSTYLQAVLQLGAEGFELAPEPPAFVVHALVDGDVVSHVQPVARRA